MSSLNTSAQQRWLRILNKTATETFILERHPISTSRKPIREPTERNELKNWLRDAQYEAKRTRANTRSGQIKLALINGSQGLWIGSGDPTVYIRDLLHILDMPGRALTFYDVVESRVYPPVLDRNGLPPSQSSAPISQSVACNSSGLAWIHYPETHLTVGLAWFFGDEGRRERDIILRDLEKLQRLMVHPSLPALVSLKAMTIQMYSWVSNQRLQVHEAQIMTGYHKYRRVESGRRMDNLDYGQLSAQVSGTAANIASSEICLRGLCTLGASILEQNEVFARYQHLLAKDEIGAIITFVEQHARYWVKESTALLQDAESWRHKASIVIQGIFNLIAQRDQNTSIGIAKDSKILAEQSQKIAYESRILAEESKRDSTSMKAIAAVTMFFLPGTFAAVSQRAIFVHFADQLLMHNLAVLLCHPDFRLGCNYRESGKSSLLDLLGSNHSNDNSYYLDLDALELDIGEAQCRSEKW